MSSDPIRGKTLRWSFDGGPVAGKTFEHTFDEDGSLTFSMVDGDKAGKPMRVEKYEAATVAEGVHAVSYLGPSGWTLTVVLDFASGRCVAFASNDKQVTVQRGIFETVGGAPMSQRRAPQARGSGRSLS